MNKLIPSYQSHKLRVCSFVLIVLIVWLHSNLTQFGATGVNYDIQHLVSHGFASVGVVMFFTISGFLFFYTDKSYNFSFFKYKLSRRFYSLVIPFVLWNCIALCIASLAYYSQRVFHTPPSLIEPPISSFSDFVLYIFYYNKTAYQLWFLRDLIIFAILSPLLYYVIHLLQDFFIVILLLYGIFPFPIGFVGSDPIFFYSLGAFLAIVHPKFLFYQLSSKVTICIITVYFIGVCFQCLSLFSFFQTNALFSLSLRILGCLVLWFGYDRIRFLQHSNNKLILGATFFIFVAHEPLLTIIKKIMIYYIGGNSQVSLFLVFMTAPIIVISLCVSIKKMLSSYLPSVSKILNGNR